MRRVDLSNCIECGKSMGPPRTGDAMRGIERKTCSPECKRARKNKMTREARTSGRYDLRRARKKENNRLGVGAVIWRHCELGVRYIVVTRSTISECETFDEAREEYALRFQGKRRARAA